MAFKTVLVLVLTTNVVSGMNIAYNTTTTLSCQQNSSIPPFPVWYINNSEIPAISDYTTKIDPSTGDLIGILVIDGNETSGTLKLRCAMGGQTTFTTNITIKGPLSSPENLILSTQDSSTQLQWKPPYYTMNQESDVIHVDPHITQYTVYTSDGYNRRMIHSVNTTETSFTPTHNVPLCPMYQVSAWNAGGEGELSEPVQDGTPQVPLIENINVTVTAQSGALQFHIEVGVVCTSRMPEFFLITLMSGSEITRHHQRDFTISAPPNVDVCTIRPRISAGNAAGTSIETVVVGGSTDSTTTASTATAVSTVASTGSEPEGDRQQGVSFTTLIAIGIGVIAAIVGVVIVAATVAIICYRKYRRRKVDPSTQTDGNNFYSESPSLGGPVPLYKPPVTEVVYVTSEQTTSRPVSRDPESTANWMQTLDSAPSTSSTESGHSGDHLLLPSSRLPVDRDPKGNREQTQSSDSADSATSSSSTDSGGSGDPLLPPSPSVPAGSPHLVYAQLNVKQTQVQPPANDDLVQYAQIEHQDKL